MDFIPEPKLPYAVDALAPYISKETLEYHHGKHHMAYYNKLKQLRQGKEPKTLEMIIVEENEGGMLNQAGQLYNHAFYWKCMAPAKAADKPVPRPPTGRIAELIDKTFGSFDAMRTKFNDVAAAAFGSGWVFLVQDPCCEIRIVEQHDGKCPLKEGLKPLLCLDVWEHAYYIDYRNVRVNYIEAWWALINWDFVNEQLNGPVYSYQTNN